MHERVLENAGEEDARDLKQTLLYFIRILLIANAMICWLLEEIHAVLLLEHKTSESVNAEQHRQIF